MSRLSRVMNIDPIVLQDLPASGTTGEKKISMGDILRELKAHKRQKDELER